MKAYRVPDRKRQVIDFEKLSWLTNQLGCNLDDLFEWTDLEPTEFIKQIADTAGFDVKAFLETDVEALDFKKIMTDKGLFKKLSVLPKGFRTIDNAVNLSLLS